VYGIKAGLIKRHSIINLNFWQQGTCGMMLHMINWQSSSDYSALALHLLRLIKKHRSWHAKDNLSSDREFFFWYVGRHH